MSDRCPRHGLRWSDCFPCSHPKKKQAEQIHPSQQEPDLEKSYNELLGDYLLVRTNRDELLKDMAELHPVQECASEIYRLRSALEKIANPHPMWTEGAIRQIAINALQTPPLPF